VFLKVLDKMLLYLRIVHSFDYYSTMEYPNENEMPHRCGIVHCRGAVPSGRMTQTEGKCNEQTILARVHCTSRFTQYCCCSQE